MLRAKFPGGLTYVPFQSNDYNRCSGNPQTSYHYSTARIVGIAK
jgi:hypothetical protein